MQIKTPPRRGLFFCTIRDDDIRVRRGHVRSSNLRGGSVLPVRRARIKDRTRSEAP